MSLSIPTRVAPQARERQDPAYKRLVTARAVASISGVAAPLACGFDYDVTSPADRAYHPRHLILRPSAGAGLFVLIFLYALRKSGVAGQSREFAPLV